MVRLESCQSRAKLLRSSSQPTKGLTHASRWFDHWAFPPALLEYPLLIFLSVHLKTSMIYDILCFVNTKSSQNHYHMKTWNLEGPKHVFLNHGHSYQLFHIHTIMWGIFLRFLTSFPFWITPSQSILYFDLSRMSFHIFICSNEFRIKYTYISMSPKWVHYGVWNWTKFLQTSLPSYPKLKSSQLVEGNGVMISLHQR